MLFYNGGPKWLLNANKLGYKSPIFCEASIEQWPSISSCRPYIRSLLTPFPEMILPSRTLAKNIPFTPFA